MKKLNFVSVSFSRLRRNEIRVLVNRLVELFEQFDSETLKLTFVFDKLVEAQSDLRLIQTQEGKNPKTAELNVKRDNLKRLIRTLVTQVRVLNTANRVVAIPHLEVLSPVVVRFLNPIVNANSTVQTDVLDEMFSVLEKDDTFQPSIEALNLKVLFDELKVLHQSYSAILTERMNSRIRSVVETSEVRLKTNTALNNLMKEIELAQLKYPEANYNALIEKMNEIFSFYSAQAKARKTIRKKVNVRKVTTTTTTAQNGNSGAVAN